MAPRYPSRYLFTEGLLDAVGITYLSNRIPFKYVDLPDNIVHIVVEGDTLFHLAGRYYAGFEELSNSLWSFIADFQPDGGYFDPTVQLTPGSVVYVPSERTVSEIILSESRRLDTEL